MRSLAIALIALVSSVQADDWYDWSEPAPHHASVCQIVCNGARGSGAYVTDGHFRFVLTAAHVVDSGGSATVTFQDGIEATGRAMIDRNYRDRGYDVGAVLTGSIEGITPLKIYSGPINSDLEICGFGGPMRKLRHFNVKLTNFTLSSRSSSRLQTDGNVINGDSGGPWLIDGQVAGISSTGFGALNKVESLSGGPPFTIYNGATSTNTSIIRDFVSRLHSQECAAPS